MVKNTYPGVSSCGALRAIPSIIIKKYIPCFMNADEAGRVALETLDEILS